MKKLAILLGVLILILAGCSDNSVDYSQFNMPTDFTPVTVVVEHEDYKLQNYVIADETYDHYADWLEKKRALEEYDRYETYSDVWAKEREERENGEQYDEEKRIEAYCLEHGYWKCMKITETCDDDGCYEVHIECTDEDFELKWLEPGEYDPDHECGEYEVEILE